MNLDTEELTAWMDKLEKMFPNSLGWRFYVCFADDLPPDQDAYEFIIPSSRERCWVLSKAERHEIVPYLASDSVSELNPEGFAMFFRRWAIEASSEPPGYTVH